MSYEDCAGADVDERVCVDSRSTHILSPSFNRHPHHFSPSIPSQKLESVLPFLTPKVTRQENRPQLSRFISAKVIDDFELLFDAPEPYPESPAAEAFSEDFDQHFKRIVSGKESTITYSQLSELLTDMHLLSPLASTHKPLLAQFWQVLVKPEAASVQREDVKKALKIILGIASEPSFDWTRVKRTFQNFATSRLRYLNLQAAAIESAEYDALPAKKPGFNTAKTSKNPTEKENNLSPSKIPVKSQKPMLPLGRNPTELLRSRQTFSPLRIPEMRKILATVKVNISPDRFDVINVFRGDCVKDLALKFAEKHGLGAAVADKLKAMLEAKLQSKINSLD